MGESHCTASLPGLCTLIILSFSSGCDAPPSTPKIVQRRVTKQLRDWHLFPPTTVETLADLEALETAFQNGEKTSNYVVLNGAEIPQLLTRLAASPFGQSVRKVTLEAVTFDNLRSLSMVKLSGVASLGFERCNLVGVTTDQLRRMRPPSVVSLGFRDCTLDVPASEKFSDVFVRLEHLWLVGKESQIEPGVAFALSRGSRRTIRELSLSVDLSSEELRKTVDGMPLQEILFAFPGMSDEHFEVLSRHPSLARINTVPCLGASQSLFRSIEARTGIDVNYDDHPECP